MKIRKWWYLFQVHTTTPCYRPRQSKYFHWNFSFASQIFSFHFLHAFNCYHHRELWTIFCLYCRFYELILHQFIIKVRVPSHSKFNIKRTLVYWAWYNYLKRRTTSCYAQCTGTFHFSKTSHEGIKSIWTITLMIPDHDISSLFHKLVSSKLKHLILISNGEYKQDTKKNL